MKKILLSALFLCFAIEAFSDVKEPETLDKRHWVYFGWEEDHPKAVSLMGGAVYARRPHMPNRDSFSWKFSREPWHAQSDAPVFFMIGVDGSAPYYPDEKSPDRKKEIRWSLAEGYLPFPVSEWEYRDIQVEITHVGRRVLNNIVDIVYSRIRLKNMDKDSHKVKLSVIGNAVAERVFPLKTNTVCNKSSDRIEIEKQLSPGKEAVYEFALPANGTSSAVSILSLGGFAKNYKAEKNRILSRMDRLTMPMSLPDPRFIELWKSSMTYMWNATVRGYDELEQRGSGGNVYGLHQYDQVFNHDVPDMVIQYILEGNIDFAKKIMSGTTYENLSEGKLVNTFYLDAIPKYIITMAQYLQITGDKSYFTDELLSRLKRCSRAVNAMRRDQMDEGSKKMGVYGLLQKGSTLDNGARTFLIVDNFAALHGYTAYRYICKRFNLTDELNWVNHEMKDLNECLNKAIEKSVRDSGRNWYNACFSFDDDTFLTSGPGNWLGTTFMMPTFPWNACLKGLDLRGAWSDYFDPSIEKWLEKGKSCGCPEGSVGAWWGAKYGSIYNAGMVMPLLYSEKYRTYIPKSICWLIENQTAPYHWGESFRKSGDGSDWTFPAADLETWGLGFIRQAMLQMCVSLCADGTVILGRGIPDEWVDSEKEIKWKNIYLNDGRKMDLSFQKIGNRLDINMKGEHPTGNFIVNLPILKSNIDHVDVKSGRLVSTDDETGSIVTSSKTTAVSVYLKR